MKPQTIVFVAVAPGNTEMHRVQNTLVQAERNRGRVSAVRISPVQAAERHHGDRRSARADAKPAGRPHQGADPGGQTGPREDYDQQEYRQESHGHAEGLREHQGGAHGRSRRRRRKRGARGIRKGMQPAYHYE